MNCAVGCGSQKGVGCLRLEHEYVADTRKMLRFPHTAFRNDSSRVSRVTRPPRFENSESLLEDSVPIIKWVMGDGVRVTGCISCHSIQSFDVP